MTGDGSMVELTGEFDIANREELAATLELLPSGTTIDMSSVAFADHRALELLRARSFRLVNVPPRMLRLLDLIDRP